VVDPIDSSVERIAGFHGSYVEDDVTFLLTVIALPRTPLQEKEALIQRGEKHYSEMLGDEHVPSSRYLALFDDAVARNGARLARDIGVLADRLAASHERVCLVSLARAGTPIGVLLRRALARRGVPVRHASISIIAGRGVDEAALDHLRGHERVADHEIIFVDGWTGKGVISDALTAAVQRYNASRQARLDDTLHVVVDLCGRSRAAATTDDYLIPSCLLGATVSGLVSRSILNEVSRAAGPFHGCAFSPNLGAVDRSRSFVDEIDALSPSLAPASPPVTVAEAPRDLVRERRAAHDAVAGLCERLALPPAHIKVGIGEATRVLLRRVPQRLVVRDPGFDDVRGTVALAEEKGIVVEVDAALPWAALAVIERVA